MGNLVYVVKGCTKSLRVVGTMVLPVNTETHNYNDLRYMSYDLAQDYGYPHKDGSQKWSRVKYLVDVTPP